MFPAVAVTVTLYEPSGVVGGAGVETVVVVFPPQPINIPTTSRPKRADTIQNLLLLLVFLCVGMMKRPTRPSAGSPVQYASRNGVADRRSIDALVSPVAKVKVEGKVASSPVAFNIAGLKEHVECAGSPVQVSPIVPTKVLADVMVRLTVALLPLLTATDGAANDREKSVVPVPLRETESAGFVGSDVAMLSDAEFAPVATGLKVTEIAQLAAGPTSHRRRWFRRRRSDLHL